MCAAVRGLFNQQYGNLRYKNYETILPRLRCIQGEEFKGIHLNNEEENNPVFVCKFAHHRGNENLLALADEEGTLALHKVTHRDRVSTQAHNNAIFDITWMCNDPKIVTASGDHVTKLFSVGDGYLQEERAFYGHTRSVKSVVYRKDDPACFASGGRDGNIILWDTRCEASSFVRKSEIFINNSHLSKGVTPRKFKRRGTPGGTPQTPSSGGMNPKSVTGLVFQDYDTLISCGAGDGVIKFWDMRKTYTTHKREPTPKFSIPYTGKSTRNGYSSLLVDPNGVKLYANCLDNYIYCYNISSYDPTPIMYYYGHQNLTFYIKSNLSHDSNFLISGSSDDNAYIWNLKKPYPVCKLVGHTAEVTCVAWRHLPEPLIVTCSDDYKHKFWRIYEEEKRENWNVEGRGEGEYISPSKAPLCIYKRKASALKFEDDTPKKHIAQCEKCTNATAGVRFCENCNKQSSNKRKNDKNQEDAPESKKQQLDFGPRRLFSTLHNLQKNVPPIKEEQLPQSPTINLPNFVVDGVAPHINYSPPAKRQQDWLTKIRIEKTFKRKMENPNYEDVGHSPKVPKLTQGGSPRVGTVNRFVSPLLKYFKVTNNMKDNGKNHTHTTNSFCNSPKSSQ